MVTRRNIIIIGCIALAGIAVYLFLFENEETKVKKRFDFISDCIEKIPGENPIVGATNINRLKEAVSKTLTVKAPAYSISRTINIKDLSAYTLARRLHFKELSLQFYDFHIEFTDDTTADVSVTARMSGQLKSGDFVEETHELACRLQKNEDLWKLSLLEVVDVLVK